jgi:hypothetical protein
MSAAAEDEFATLAEVAAEVGASDAPLPAGHSVQSDRPRELVGLLRGFVPPPDR